MIDKNRVYVDDESEVPEHRQMQISDSGAMYYETEGDGTGGSPTGGGEDDSGEADTNLDDVEFDYEGVDDYRDYNPGMSGPVDRDMVDSVFAESELDDDQFVNDMNELYDSRNENPSENEVVEETMRQMGQMMSSRIREEGGDPPVRVGGHMFDDEVTEDAIELGQQVVSSLGMDPDDVDVEAIMDGSADEEEQDDDLSPAASLANTISSALGGGDIFGGDSTMDDADGDTPVDMRT